MQYKALKSFTGLISMVKGQVQEIKDGAIVKDLLQAGYIAEEKAKEVKEKIKDEVKEVETKVETKVKNTKSKKSIKK